MCFICDRLKLINDGINPYFVKELETGYVVIGDNQHFKGYTLFLLFPRKSGDIENYGNNGKGPVWWYPMEKMYSDDNRPSDIELKDLKEKLLIELENLL